MDIAARLRPWASLESWKRRGSTAWSFARLVAHNARSEQLGQRAAALAFITMVALVPLLSALSFFGSGASLRHAQVVETLALFLPFRQSEIVAALDRFLGRAQELSGLGFLAFLITALVAMRTVDRTLNRTWKVPRRRPFWNRLMSHSLILVFGPLLIGAAQSGMFLLGRHPFLLRIAQADLAPLLPFLFTTAGLTLLYFFAPYTRVRWRYAFGGAVVGALLLEALRWGFHLYIAIASQLSAVYGSLGLVLLFVVSIDVGWWMVLLGNEVAYCAQSRKLIRSRLANARLAGSWLGLAALMLIADRLRRGEPITPHELLVERLRVGPTVLRRLMAPLVRGGLVRETIGRAGGFLLSCDPYQLPVQSVLALYEASDRRLLTSLRDDRLTDGDAEDHAVAAIAEALGALQTRSATVLREEIGDLPLSDLLGHGKSLAAS